jgi:hypothetical protein
MFPQQHPWHTVTCPITSRFVTSEKLFVLSIQFLYSRATADDWEMNPRASFFAEETGGRSLAEFKMKVISEET